jgi:hypothetical protein
LSSRVHELRRPALVYERAIDQRVDRLSDRQVVRIVRDLRSLALVGPAGPRIQRQGQHEVAVAEGGEAGLVDPIEQVRRCDTQARLVRGVGV